MAFITFEKTVGLGNDFMSVRRADVGALTPERIRAWGDRRRGPGFDQLFVFETENAPGADVTIGFYNADGSPAGACGNGSRCAAALFSEMSGKRDFTLGVRHPETGVCRFLSASVKEDGFVTLNMGKPAYEAAQIPLAEAVDPEHILFEDIYPLPGACVNVGNPHIVFFTDEEVDNARLTAFGSQIETRPLFPERINVEFARICGDNHIRMRVWERGAGITEACGTGACATAALAARKNLVDPARPIRLTMDGGDLYIALNPEGEILMTGEAKRVFTGKIAL